MKTGKILFALTVLVLAFTAAGCSGGKKTAAPALEGGSAEQPFKIRVGVDSSSFSFQFRVAEKAGIFDKYNVDAEIFTFSYGIDTVNAAILGEVDSAEAYDFAVASRFSESNKLRIVSTIVEDNVEQGDKLYTRNVNVKTLADLKGKRLGVQKATRNEYIWARFFEKHGLNPKELTQVYLSSNAELAAAYMTNEIDAFWAPPETEKAVKEIPTSVALGNYSLSGVTGRGYLLLDAAIIARDPAGVERYIKALDEATAFIKERPGDTAKIIYDDLKISEEVTLSGIKSKVYDVRLTQEDLDHITSVAEWSIENGLIKNRYNISDFVDPQPLRNVLPERVNIR